MGHSRLGRLPKRWGWEKVIEVLKDPNASIKDIVQLTSDASKKVLLNSKNMDGLTICYWLYTNIAFAAKQNNFVKQLNNLGIKLEDKDSGFDIIRKIYDTASDELTNNGRISILDKIALDSFQKSLQETIIAESNTLFGCNLDSIQKAFSKYSTNDNISYLSRKFFSQYAYKAFSFAIEKELANSISNNGNFRNSSDLARFDERLKTYCWDISKILEKYSGGWYSKHCFVGDISEKKSVKRFTKYAMEKLLAEVTLEDTK